MDSRLLQQPGDPLRAAQRPLGQGGRLDRPLVRLAPDRQLGGATMLIVVARLFVVDMASVEAVWRVVLFLAIGAVFLFAGYKLQPTRS